MSRPIAPPAFVLCLLLAAVPAASAGLASPPPPPPRGGVEKTAEGRVTEFAAGRRLSLRLSDGSTVSFRLDEPGLETAVEPGVAVGVRARVVESRRVDGARSLSVTVVPDPGGRT